MNSSAQEKEKLKKLLQKLFTKEENLKSSATGKINIPKQHSKDEVKYFHEEMPIDPTIKKHCSTVNKSQNMKKRKSQLESRNASNISTPHNGFIQVEDRSFANKKSQGMVSNKGKLDQTKLQSKANSIAKNPKEKLNSKQQNQHNIQLNSSPQNHDKIKKLKRNVVWSKSESKNKLIHPEKIELNASPKLKNDTKSKNALPQSNNVANNQTKLNKNHKEKAKKRPALDDTLNNVPILNKKQKIIKKVKGKIPRKSIQNKKCLNVAYDSSSSQFDDECDVLSKKKHRLNVKEIQKTSKNTNQKEKYLLNGSNSSLFEDGNLSTGCGRADDFDSDYEGDINMQAEDYSEGDYSSDNTYEENNKINKSEENTEADLNRYEKQIDCTSKENNVHKKIKHNSKYYEAYEISGSDEDSNRSDDYNDLDYYENDSFEEEEENYSDFDENDYEEEEDSYNYSTESHYEYYSNSDDYDNSSYDSDDDYELPQHIPEDLIIHKGTANTRDIKPEDNVCFNSDIEESHIVELENQQTVEVIYQPKAYEKDELLKLKYKKESLSAISYQQKNTREFEECPKLVPTLDIEDFRRLFKSNGKTDNEENVADLMEDYEEDTIDGVSLGSEYTEINSDEASSFLSEDINEKYLKRDYVDSENDSSIDENMWFKKHKVDIIDATGDYKCLIKNDNLCEHTEDSLNDDIKQLPSVKLYKNVDLKTKTNILSTTIVGNEIFLSNSSFVDNLYTNSNETQNTSKKGAQVSSEQISIIQDEDSSEREHCTEAFPKVANTYGYSLANYNTKFFNAFDSNCVMVLLKDPFYIYGTVRLTLLAGTVEVYGHSLTLNTEVEIFSPRGCSVIEIASTHEKSNTSSEDLKHLLKPYEQQFALADLNTIATSYNCETDAVVLLKRNEARKKIVQQYKKFMNENVFPNINNINADRPLYNSEYLLRCMINISTQEQKCLRLPEEWQQFSLTAKSRVMLAGGKGVGKSTLLRYLINRHLPQKVLLIDLDIGQPEVFMPQTISCTIIEQPLLGPGFLLNLQPEISYAIGHVNIVLCAYKYLTAVRYLIAHCKSQEAYKDIPWLINTMGYNKGFGLELISVLAQECLTDVIQIQSTKEINNFESHLHGHVLSNVQHILFSEEHKRNNQVDAENWTYRLHIWQSPFLQESRYQKEWEMSGKNIRFAMLLARLSDALQGHADWLTDVKPLSASLDDLKIINLMDNTPLATAEDLEKTVEANLVYLCHYEDDSKPLKCLGIGVVRAIDFHIRQLYLIPALPYIYLKDVNCLGIGEMPLPTSLFTNQGPRIKNIAPFVYNTISANASKAIKQIYHRPSKFLTSKHKSLD